MDLPVRRHPRLPSHDYTDGWYFITICTDERKNLLSPRPTVSSILCTYKSLTTRRCKIAGYRATKLFQTSFYDHIIRDETDYLSKAAYITENPEKWLEDSYHNT